MTIGQKIKKLRTGKGLTQKDLADQVHVTFQTVSKWEKDENEPDLNTMKAIAKLFGVTVDYLINEDEEAPKKEVVEKPVVATPVEVVNKTVVIHHNEAHVCARCGKDIAEKDLVSEDVTKRERFGRTTRTVNIGQTYYHKACLEEVKKERAEQLKKERALQASKGKRRCFGWGIAGGVVALGLSLAVFLSNPQLVHPALAVLFSILIGYAIFAMVYCIVSGSYISDVFLWCATLSIKFPGLIFSWDLEGFIWVIAMKILFAILGFIIGIFALIFAIVFSGTLGAFSFPFVLVHNIRTDYQDAF